MKTCTSPDEDDNENGDPSTGQEAINRASRHARRLRRLGPSRACAACGFDGPEALERDADRVRCYECQCTSCNRPSVEFHHHLGRTTDPSTVPVPGNQHRALSDAQLDRPEALRNGANGNALHWFALAALGLRDQLAWWVGQLGSLATFCVALAAWIRTLPLTPELRASAPTLRGMRIA